MNLTVLDGVFAILVVIAVIIGIIKGFFDLITPPIKLIAAVSVTFLLAGIIIDGWTGPLFSELISNSISESLATNYPELSSANAEEVMPVMFKILAFFAGVDIGNTAEIASEGTVATAIGSAIGAPVGNFVAVAVTYLGLFIIVSLLLKIFLTILGSVLTAGPLKAVDKSLGVVFAVAVSSVICCIIATITNSVSPDFDGGFVYDFFLSLNPFLAPQN